MSMRRIISPTKSRVVSIRKRLLATLARRPAVLRLLATSKMVPDSLMLTILNESEFAPVQRRSEVLALVNLIRTTTSTSLLEIGTARGGTTLLTARALRRPGRLTTVDLEARYSHDRLDSSLPRGVETSILLADSHDPKTSALVSIDGMTQFDVVFIDGDHSYAGVRLDTETFAPLARPGGFLVFHDIQAANETDQGVYVGGVPDWWGQISAVVPERTETFIADNGQSGFGIGVIHLPETPHEMSQLFHRWAQLERLDWRTS